MHNARREPRVEWVRQALEKAEALDDLRVHHGEYTDEEELSLYREHFADLIQKITILEGEKEELQAVVDRLPKTEDGVTITEGSVTWCNGRDPFPHAWHIRVKNGERFAEHCARDREKHYNTREAAQAAADGEENRS